MKVEFRVEAMPNERRRFLGGADVTPMVELVSEMLDDVMMLFVEARLSAIEARESDAGPPGGQRDDDRGTLQKRIAP